MDSARATAAEDAENANDTDEEGLAFRVGGRVRFTFWMSRPKIAASAFSASSVPSAVPSS